MQHSVALSAKVPPTRRARKGISDAQKLVTRAPQAPHADALKRQVKKGTKVSTRKVSLLDIAIRGVKMEGLYDPKWERSEFVETLSVEYCNGDCRSQQWQSGDRSLSNKVFVFGT